MAWEKSELLCWVGVGAQVGEVVGNPTGEIQFKFTYISFENAYKPVAGNYFGSETGIRYNVPRPGGGYWGGRGHCIIHNGSPWD